MRFESSCSRIALSTFVCSACLAVSACGGGGSPAPSPSPAPVQTAPRITSPATVSLVENTSDAFYTATATDPQGDSITWEVFSGVDAGEFVIDADGNLSFQNAPNFDLPADANQDNIYLVTLRAAAGGETDSLSLSVNVTNDREGIEVRRIVTGLSDPVSLNWANNGREFMVTEKSGRVLFYDTTSGGLQEDVIVRDNRRPGEVLAGFYGFAGADRYGSGVILITRSPTDGLAMQVFDPLGRDFQYLPFGDPWQEEVKVSIQDYGGRVLVAVGDPGGTLAQNASSAYGKLFSITPLNPYSMASIPPDGTRLHRIETIGDGLRSPGGLSSFDADLVIVEQGGSTAHGITLFRDNWRPLDFGWPFYEGATEVRANAPARVNGPTIAYNYGTGRGEGMGPVGFAGELGAPAGLARQVVFFDVSGKVFSIPAEKTRDGFRHGGHELEERTLDFEPDEGTIDSPVDVQRIFSNLYILDSDGEIFAVPIG